MNTNLLNVIKEIIEKYGETVLCEPRRVNSLFADLAREEPKPHKTALVKCLEYGFVQTLKNVPAPDRGLCKQRLAQKLHDEEGLDLVLCGDAVELLAAVLFGGEQKQEEKPRGSFCKNCGKELQEGWKACPFCLTAVENPSIGSAISSISSSSGSGGYGIGLIKPTAPKPAAKKPAAKKAKEISSGYEMVFVPGGSFQMGDTAGGGNNNERPVHKVTLSAFSIGKYQVTKALYESVMGNNYSRFKGSNLPVECVSWYDAVEFCNKLSGMEGLQPVYTITSAMVTPDWSRNGYRLPTEAEWEYAAKGGNGSPGNYRYAGSNNVDSVAWYDRNSRETIHKVGTKAPNSLGLYDMSGNVWEWCWDWYGSYPGGEQTDPRGASSGSGRVLRGGGWHNTAANVRAAYRFGYTPSGRGIIIGFRLVRP